MQVMKKSAICFLALVMVCVASVSFAQTPITIPVDVPQFDYAAVAVTLLGLLGTAIAGAIGLGLSFFAVRWIYRAFRSMAR
jgi:hypothetical protein